MALVKCSRCGNEFPEENGVCPNCGLPASSSAPSAPGRKKHSGMSIAAFIFALLGCTFLIGLILAIVDLCKKDKAKKHSLSIAALVISCVYILFGVAAGSLPASETSSVAEVETVTEEVSTAAVTESDASEPVSPVETEISESSEDSASSVPASESSAETVSTEESSAAEEPVSDMTTGQANALRSAQNYLDFSAFSYEGLIDQLEFEEYSTDEATFAADNCGADWNEQALKSALSYLDFSAFSYEGLISQLEYEQFTHEQAVYGADNCGADWNEQAAKCAESYLEYSSFSREGLIDQLLFEGFTQEQAEYGASENGY